jgi:hypothetical protein
MKFILIFSSFMVWSMAHAQIGENFEEKWEEYKVNGVGSRLFE